MFRLGERILFRADTRPFNGGYQEFFLGFIEKDENGILMSGDVPPLWRIGDGQVGGPVIFDDDYRYQIQKVDYKRKMVWLADLN